jgi:prepilin-type N-terminal cleavage/methylation domain-containing protein
MQAHRRNQRKKSGGFTLMELLIVIAVLGLLLGMLIPRLGGVTDETVDTVCDSNNKGIRYFTQMFYNKEGVLPDGLTNMVTTADGATYALASREDGRDTAPGAEVVADEFWSRNWPGLYELNDDEVDELEEMGITKVYDLVGWDGSDTSAMFKHPLAGGNSVMMMGVSYDGTDFAYSGGEVDLGDAGTAGTIDDGTLTVGNPTWIGRIMMPVNDHCDLVEKGYIQASALCPGAVLNEENFSGKEYYIILPRLAASVTAISGGIATLDADETITFENTENNRKLDFEFSAQAAWQFDLSCPEGHKWPDYDEESWTHDSGLN